MITDPKTLDSHLIGYTEQEKKFIRTFSQIFVNTIIKITDEKSLPIHPEIQRRAV